jgi:putative membrane protein
MLPLNENSRWTMANDDGEWRRMMMINWWRTLWEMHKPDSFPTEQMNFCRVCQERQMKETDPLMVALPADNNKSSLPTLYTLIREGVVLTNEGTTARDHLANECTFLAWIRTALSISGVGLGLLQWQVDNGAGYLVLSLGVLLLVTSTVRYLKLMRQLSQRQFEPNVQGALVVVSVILIVIVALLGLQTTHNF